MKIARKNIYLIAAALVAVLLCVILFTKHNVSSSPSVAQVESKPIVVDSFNFLVLGDWGRNGEFHQKDVADQMDKFTERWKSLFIISTGDNFYDRGVKDIHDALWSTSFENIYNGKNLKQDWFVVLGNHDYHGSTQAEIKYHQVDPRWNMPAAYYTVVKAINAKDSARFIFIDTTPLVKSYHAEAADYPDVAKQDTTKQMRWLDSLLQTSKEKWKFVIGHHPVYSASSKHGDTPELISLLQHRFDKYQVDAYLCGHDHDLQHLQKKGSHTEFIISGAGSEIRPAAKNDMSLFSQSTHGFACISLTSDTMRINFLNKDGGNIYSFVKIKGAL